MKYIIDKEDIFYGNENTSSVIISLNDIIRVKYYPASIINTYTGRVLEVGTNYVKLDISKQYHSENIILYFKNFMSVEVVSE